MTEPQGDARHLETLDRDLERFSYLENATTMVAKPMVGMGISLVFVVIAGLAAMLFFGQASNTLIVVVAACLGAYMALNIGANDVANNMGPAVGANALSMGGAIAIVCNGQIAYMKGYGTAVYDPDGSAPFTKNTSAGIGSISKVLTAMATMKLVEMGEVNLDAAITTYLDPGVPTEWSEVTVRDLLSHRSGIERDPDSGLDAGE